MRPTKLERFDEQVLSRYQIYNSIFMTLPYDEISNTGVLLPLFQDICQRGFEKEKNPTQIVEEFFARYQQEPTEHMSIESFRSAHRTLCRLGRIL